MLIHGLMSLSYVVIYFSTLFAIFVTGALSEPWLCNKGFYIHTRGLKLHSDFKRVLHQTAVLQSGDRC
jgi:hypothetical protein